MPNYRYQMVQIPPTLVVKQARGDDAAAYLESVVNDNAAKGWEFWRVDSIGLAVEPGCLGALVGGKRTHTIFHVITFRKAVES